LVEDTPSPIIREYHYIWIKDGSNFVAIKFNSASKEKVVEAFSSPTSTVVDTELVTYLKGMVVGDAIELPKDPVLSDRSLKVRVNKAAKLAGRTLDWGALKEGGFIARVTNELEPATNGEVTNSEVVTETTTEVTPASAEETPNTSGRNRR
jgi:hypothetical protein